MFDSGIKFCRSLFLHDNCFFMLTKHHLGKTNICWGKAVRSHNPVFLELVTNWWVEYLQKGVDLMFLLLSLSRYYTIGITFCTIKNIFQFLPEATMLFPSLLIGEMNGFFWKSNFLGRDIFNCYMEEARFNLSRTSIIVIGEYSWCRTSNQKYLLILSKH